MIFRLNGFVNRRWVGSPLTGGSNPRDIFAKSRIKVRAEARGLLCYWAVNELNMPLSDLVRKLTMRPTGVSYAVRRGEVIVRENNFQLFD
jgi:hypothetical protein